MFNCYSTNETVTSAEIDPDLAEAIAQNSRRYIAIVSEAVAELLPDYKEREVTVADVRL